MGMENSTAFAAGTVAIPSNGEGGLAQSRSEHFGRASHFTIVEIADGKVGQVRTVENLPHIEGGCRRPVDMLVAGGVTAALVVGMGTGPFNGFAAAGVPVYADRVGATVGDAVARLINGEVELLSGSACHHH